MPIYAIIKDGVVENTVEYTVQPATPPPGFNEGYVAVLADGASRGWSYVDGVFVDPTPPMPIAPIAPNWDQFLTDAYNNCLAVATGTPEERLIEVSRRMDQYPSFVTAAQRENLALLQVVIARAHADYLVNPSTGISPVMEAAIRAAMVANHIIAA